MVLRGHESGVFRRLQPRRDAHRHGVEDKTARIWDAATGKEIAVLRGHEDRVNSAAFSPDGSRIVTASWTRPRASGTPRPARRSRSCADTRTTVTSAAFSPDGRASSRRHEDKTARIWDAATGKEIAVLRGHEDGVTSAAFSPDGSRIVTASWDNTARIWDAATGKEITVLRGHEDRCDFRRLQPRRVAHRHGVIRQHRAHLGRRDRQGDRGPARTRGRGDFRRLQPRRLAHRHGVRDKTARIWDVHFATMALDDLMDEVCLRRLGGLTTFTRDEMRLAGYADDAPAIDVCAGIGLARSP